MCFYPSRCNGTNCIGTQSILLGCQSLGGKCLGCARAIFVTLSPVTGNSPNPSDTTGIFLYGNQADFVGWKITQVGLSTGLQVGDVVTSINGQEPDADFFEALTAEEGNPMTFDFVLYRGAQQQTLTLTRA